MRGKLAKWTLLVMTVPLLGGCWDRIEIDQRGFVVGVAVDLPEEVKETQGSKKSDRRLQGTFQFVIPAGMKSGDSSSQNGGGKAYFNMNSVESSLPSISGNLAQKTSRTPYFEHLKIIVVSSKVAAKEGAFPEVLDYFLRDNEMRRNVKILIADGRASDMLKVKVYNEKYPVAYLESTVKNSIKSNYMLPESRIGDVHEYFMRKESYPIQLVKTSELGIVLSGAAIIEGTGNRLVGFMSGKETQGLNFIRNWVEGGSIEVEYDRQMVVFEVERTRRKMSAQMEAEGRVAFKIAIQAEGTLGKSTGMLDVNDENVVRKLESRLEKEIVNIVNQSVQVAQHKFKLDPLGLGAYLYQNRYPLWKRVMRDWERGSCLFCKAKVDVDAEVTIRRIGNINKNER